MDATVQITRFTPSAWLREGLAGALLLASAVLLACRYQMLPLLIHSPFNHGGDAHGLASRSQLWLLLILGGWLYLLMSFINLLGPDAINTSRPLSAETRALWLARAKAAMGWGKVALMAGLLLWIGSYLR